MVQLKLDDDVADEWMVWRLVTEGVLPMADVDKVSLNDVCKMNRILNAKIKAMEAK